MAEADGVTNFAMAGMLTPTAERTDLGHGEYPGAINVGLGERGYANGCAFIEFIDDRYIGLNGQGEPTGETAATKMNAWFKEHTNRLVLDYKVATTDGRVRIIALYTKVISQAELEENNEVMAEARRLINERKAARQEAENKAEASRAEQERERARLIDAGRKCEEHHKALVEELRDLRAKKGRK